MKSLDELRKQYEKAVVKEEEAELMWTWLEDYEGTQGEILAYKASSRALMARYSWNPYNKLSYLKESMKFFRKAVKVDAENIEIRFLRFAIQHYIPSFLDLSEEIHEDKEVMMRNFSRYADFHLQKSHVEAFVRFFEESNRFEPEELSHIHQILKRS